MQKLLAVFVLLMATGFVTSQNSEAATAIAALVKDFFINRSMNFDFIVYRCPLVKLVDKISKSVKAPTTVLRLDNINNRFFINQSAILFFNESARFYEFYQKTTAINDYPKKLYFFVYIQNFKPVDFTQFQFNLWNSAEIFNHIYFLLDDHWRKGIDLVTITTFQQPICRFYELSLLNRFSKTTKKWENRKFIVEKFRNFNGCELVITSINTSWHYFSILKEIESNLNFTSKIVSNNTTYADFSMDHHSMRMIESFYREGKNFKYYTLTHYIYVQDLVFVVSRPEPYSFLEKALLPLDAEVWWWLIGFLAFGVTVIVVVSFMSRTIRDFVFGMKVKAPLLNMMWVWMWKFA
jgi:hypothetical protein